MTKDRPIGVLMIVENLPLPSVRRAWQECCALRDAGYRVSVISPKGPGCEASYERIDDIDVYRHRVFEASGPLGYFLEYGWAMAAWLWLSLRAFTRRRFKILHAWNPPDLIFLVAWIYRPFGVRFIFDHLDLSPEFYLAKFNRQDFFYRLVSLAERLSFKTAAVSLATNRSYREIAVKRGAKSPDHVFIVRVSPVPERMRRERAYPELKESKPLLVVYLGVMGPQDGVDILLEAIEYLLKNSARAGAAASRSSSTGKLTAPSCSARTKWRLEGRGGRAFGGHSRGSGESMGPRFRGDDGNAQLPRAPTTPRGQAAPRESSSRG